MILFNRVVNASPDLVVPLIKNTANFFYAILFCLSLLSTTTFYKALKFYLEILSTIPWSNPIL